MTKNSKKKKPMILTLAMTMAAIMLLCATFAWFTATSNKTNHFETLILDGTVSIFELFTPPTDWKPGQAITKQVAVTNNGASDVLVRVSLEEVLKMLGDGAAQKAKASSLTNGTMLAATDDIPTAMATKGYTGENGWLTPAQMGLTATTIPVGATVLGKSATQDQVTSYSFVIFQDMSYNYINLDGTQTTKAISHKMTADFSVDQETSVLTVNDPRYYYYSPKTCTQKDWAGQNEKVGKDPYDTGAVAVTPQSLDQVINLLSDSNFELTFGAEFDPSADVSKVAEGNWWYNQKDGFFYYIGAVAPGNTTVNLLEKVTLNEEADDTYGLLELDLIVLLEAIQNTTDAIASDTGWELSTNSDLYDVLTSYCEY